MDITTYIYQIRRHFVQKSTREHSRLPPTCFLGHAFRTVQILDERTAHRPHVRFGISSGRGVMIWLLLVMFFVTGLVMLLLLLLVLRYDRYRVVVFPAAYFVVRSYPLQAGGVRQEFVLVGTFSA